jgi:hypothetical protein
MNSYELCEWPTDAVFNGKIDQLKKKEGKNDLIQDTNSSSLAKHSRSTKKEMNTIWANWTLLERSMVKEYSIALVRYFMKAISTNYRTVTASLTTSKMRLFTMENSTRARSKVKGSLLTITIITHTRVSSATTQGQLLASSLSTTKKTLASPLQFISTITRPSRPESSTRMDGSIRAI